MNVYWHDELHKYIDGASNILFPNEDDLPNIVMA